MTTALPSTPALTTGKAPGILMDVESPGLDDRHRSELHTSGLSDKTILAAGIYSDDHRAIKSILGWSPKAHTWGRGMIFPFAADFQRVKRDSPRHNSDDKSIKYESPRGAENRAYFPPGCFESLPDAQAIVLTEGEKKSLCVQQHGVPCIGLVGVWGRQEKRRRSDHGRAYDGEWSRPLRHDGAGTGNAVSARGRDRLARRRAAQFDAGVLRLGRQPTDRDRCGRLREGAARGHVTNSAGVGNTPSAASHLSFGVCHCS